jgi:hypothetical protein
LLYPFGLVLSEFAAGVQEDVEFGSAGRTDEDVVDQWLYVPKVRFVQEGLRQSVLIRTRLS